MENKRDTGGKRLIVVSSVTYALKSRDLLFQRGIKAYIDDIGHLYIPTPPDGSTFTVYQSIDEYESVRSGATRGHTRAHIERRTGEEHFKEEVWI